MHLWHRRVNRSAGGTVGIWVFLVLMGMVMALPLYYAVVSSFKPFDEFFLYPPKFVALNPTWNNYRELFGFFANSMMSFWRYVFNSVFVVVCCTVLHVLFSSMAAYPLAKNEFHGKKLIFSTVVVALLFVPQVTFLTQYVVIEKLGLLNTYGALIFPYIGTSLVFLMKQFMEQIPQSVLGGGTHRWIERIRYLVAYRDAQCQARVADLDHFCVSERLGEQRADGHL